MYLLLKHSVLLSLSGTWKHVKTCLLYVCSVMCVVIWYSPSVSVPLVRALLEDYSSSVDELTEVSTEVLPT